MGRTWLGPEVVEVVCCEFVGTSDGSWESGGELSVGVTEGRSVAVGSAVPPVFLAVVGPKGLKVVGKIMAGVKVAICRASTSTARATGGAGSVCMTQD